MILSKLKKNSIQPDEDNKPRYGGWLDLALQVALTLAISVLAGFFGGRWLDQQLHTFPWITIAGVLWGAAGGTIWVVLRIKQFGDSMEEEQKRDEEPD